MRFEEAMLFLRDGFRIYRDGHKDKGSLCGDIDNVYGSFYLTIYDVLGEDWEYCERKEMPKND